MAYDGQDYNFNFHGSKSPYGLDMREVIPLLQIYELEVLPSTNYAHP